MKKRDVLDYQKDYELQLATKSELKKIKGYDFLNYLSELIIKYSDCIENEITGKENKQ